MHQAPTRGIVMVGPPRTRRCTGTLGVMVVA